MFRKSLRPHWSYFLLAGLVAACSSSTTLIQDEADAAGDDGGTGLESDGSTGSDAHSGSDAGVESDAHPSTDASGLDAAHPHDAAVSDATPTNDASSVDAADASCSNPGTPTLHFHATAGVFCPFAGPMGAPVTCAATEECCEPPVASGIASNCQTGGTSCATIGSAVWGCEETLDCTGGKICCAAGTVALDPVCGFMRSATLAASACATLCGGGEVHLCASQAECPGGTTCTPFKVKGLELGACL